MPRRSASLGSMGVTMMGRIFDLLVIITACGIAGFFALEIVGVLQDVAQWLFRS